MQGLNKKIEKEKGGKKKKIEKRNFASF